MVELEPPLSAESAPPMFETVPVVEAAPVIVEYVQPAHGYKSCFAGNRTRFSRICMMTLRRYFFVGWASDFVNVHDDAYCFSLVLGFTERVTAFLLPFSFLHVARCTFCHRAGKKKRGRLVTAIPRFLSQLYVCLFICGQSLIHGL